MRSTLSMKFPAAMIALMLAGCHAHPLPQDVAHVSTIDIVNRLRCEAANGVHAAIEKARRQSEAEGRHAERIVDVSAIGFDITFVMTEVNSAAITELTFQKDFNDAQDNFNIKLNAGWNNEDGNKRKNTRTFRVIDDLHKLRNLDCKSFDIVGRNIAYPLSGDTGMDEVVRTYIELELLTDLGDLGKAGLRSKKEIVTFSEQWKFTTELQTGGTVDLSFKSQVGTIKLTKAGFTGSARRTDDHVVNVALARDPGNDPDVIPLVGHKILAHRPRALAHGHRVAVAPAAVTHRTANATVGVRDKRLQIFLTKRSAKARNRVLFELDRRRRDAEDRLVAQSVLGRTIP